MVTTTTPTVETLGLSDAQRATEAKDLRRRLTWELEDIERGMARDIAVVAETGDIEAADRSNQAFYHLYWAAHILWPEDVKRPKRPPKLMRRGAR